MTLSIQQINGWSPYFAEYMLNRARSHVTDGDPWWEPGMSALEALWEHIRTMTWPSWWPVYAKYMDDPGGEAALEAEYTALSLEMDGSLTREQQIKWLVAEIAGLN